MDTLLSDLMLMLRSEEVRLQPYTLKDEDRPAIHARIDAWLERASNATGILV